jgi:hypothetical protein
MDQLIDIALVTWPNHPARYDYFRSTMDFLRRHLTASRHTLRWYCSAEAERDPLKPWMGDSLEKFCLDNDIHLVWRHAPANLGANMNAALALCSAPTIHLQQDDWLLLKPLDLSPGADFLVAHPETDLLRYSWPDNDAMRPTFMDDPSGWRRIDVTGRWPYGDDPHLRPRGFMDKWGWYLEGGVHGTASATLMRKLVQGKADIRVADQCYYVHGGPVSSVINDRRNRRYQR